MGLFKAHETTTSFAKVGLMGFAGSGKSYTATEIAIGLHKMTVDAGIAKADDPINWIDTETGSDWLADRFRAEGINFQSAKTRAFTDLLTSVRESQHILIIDSITHFWRELCESWAKRKKKKRLSFGDWVGVKERWGEFTDAFVNSPCNIIMCGRAGYEYDMFKDSDDEWQIKKSGIKMSTEKETGFEPSLLVRMDRRQIETDTTAGYQLSHTAVVLKDRSTVLDGKVCDNPTFEFFRPHFEVINLGGKHLGVDLTRTSESSIEAPDADGKYLKDRCEAILDDIQGTIVKHFPGQTKEDKKSKIELMEKHFGHPGWTAITHLGENELREGLATLRQELEPGTVEETVTQQAQEVF